MPTTPASLRAAADQAERDALAALDVVSDLERHHRFLEHRLTPVLDRHTADVWNSRAATASRLRLQISGTANLGRARTALAEVIDQVRRRAEVLELTAGDHRRAANLLELREAEVAAAAAAVGVAPPPVFVEPDRTQVAVPHGIR